MEFETPPPGSRLYLAAQRLGDSQSRFLGLLPHAAWQEYATAGRVLCATETESAKTQRLLGYVAFRLPGSQIKIAHLVVSPDSRRNGVAAALIRELRCRYPDRRGIYARCRRDYPAHAVWPRLGFTALGNRPGRSTQGHLLTDWCLDFGHRDLLTWEGAQRTTIPVVLDVNVFIALHGRNSDSQLTQVMSALEDRLELLVTPELNNEINRLEDGTERERLLQVAQQYPRLPVPPTAVAEREAAILSGVAIKPKRRQDVSDIRHIAYASAAGIDILVTEDRRARSRLRGAAAAHANITLTGVLNLVALLDEREGDPAYSPRALHETGFTLGEAKGDGSELPSFISTASSERRPEFERTCNILASNRPASRRVVIRDSEGSAVGLLGVSDEGEALEARLLRTRSAPLRESVAAQLVGHLRVLAYETSREVIVVTDPHLDPVVRSALQEDGYHPSDSGHIAISFHGSLRTKELRSRLTSIAQRLTTSQREAISPISDVAARRPSAVGAFQIEHQLRPLRLLDQPLETWLLPVKPAYAAELFGYPRQLFDRPSGLGMSREHVFFRGQKSGEQSPARVLWYASAPVKSVFAISSLVGVSDLNPYQADRKFHRLGVYTLDRLKQTAERSGHVRALRLADTEILQRPVPLEIMKRLADESGQTLRLFSATRVSPKLFAKLMREAMTE